eukprot:1774660-Rhodomonas_salina.3
MRAAEERCSAAMVARIERLQPKHLGLPPFMAAMLLFMAALLRFKDAVLTSLAAAALALNALRRRRQVCCP